MDLLKLIKFMADNDIVNIKLDTLDNGRVLATLQEKHGKSMTIRFTPEINLLNDAKK